jgi:hypothetical protein
MAQKCKKCPDNLCRGKAYLRQLIEKILENLVCEDCREAIKTLGEIVETIDKTKEDIVLVITYDDYTGQEHISITKAPKGLINASRDKTSPFSFISSP